MGKEALNWNVSMEVFVGGIEGRRGKGELLCLCYHFKNKIVKRK